MKQEFMMGNEAIGLGAIRAGVNFVSGYPGTPSSEILETIAKNNDGSIYVEWSVNEKAGLEVAAGAAYSGARALVTMKQVGLNVASDPLMSLAYIGVEGGMVILVADDPGPISSQTEQDTRHFGEFSKLPVFDPTSPEEAYLMIGDAFAYSEKYKTPVLFRPTTRVCHGSAAISLLLKEEHSYKGFEKDSSRFVIFPRLAYQNHLMIEERNPQIGKEFSSYTYNTIRGKGRLGIATGGITYTYVEEALHSEPFMANDSYQLLKIATPYPFPEQLALEFLGGVDEVLVLEELDPVIEKNLIFLCGKYHKKINILGKTTKTVLPAGELSVESAKKYIASFLQIPYVAAETVPTPPLPMRPPVLCAGCPHRASFYAVKMAMKGKKANFCGDIGCYTLGNAAPLDMVDTCLCMGAGITIAQGLSRSNPDAVNFAFVGDSTFFASGLTGVVNAVYNNTSMVLIILDNSTTAMTGHQPHPGTGITMMGDVVDKIKIEPILTAIGVKKVLTIDPLDFKASVAAVNEVSVMEGVTAIIFKSPCIAVAKPKTLVKVEQEKCIKCKKCIKDLGCPAIVMVDGEVMIEPSLCFGCDLCTQICPTNAIITVEKEARGKEVKGGTADEA